MQKVLEYFDSGAQLVWHVFPEARKVVVFTSPTKSQEYAADEELIGGDLFPEFTCRVSDLWT